MIKGKKAKGIYDFKRNQRGHMTEIMLQWKDNAH